jgi:DNA-binding LacI/PurR family transcriptional regulator
MQKRIFLTITEQVAAHLREEIRRGHWSSGMPGRQEVAESVGVSPQTAQAALLLLEKEGVLKSQGPGRPRRIDMRKISATDLPSLRIAILVYSASARQQDFMVGIKHELIEAGHSAFYAPWFMPQHGMNVGSMVRNLKRTKADAWIVLSGANPLLEWFVNNKVPAFSVFGRRRDLVIAGIGPDKGEAIAQATRRLIELGHRRIVFLTHTLQRLPEPGAVARSFLNELAAHGLESGPYNLPHWNEDTASLHLCLERLFQHTPPTALIADESALYVIVLQFLQKRRLRMPEDISLISTDWDRHFTWFSPAVSHIGWDMRPLVRRAVNWAANISRGKTDVRQTSIRAEFFEGGTIGPAPGERG